MSTRVHVEYACSDADVPDADSLHRWACAALDDRPGPVELSIRIVDEAEGEELNRSYRQRAGATNVLSFPFEPPPGAESALLGDLLLCAPVVAREAAEQGKQASAHWAHLVVHGVLHLLGYDHKSKQQARVMEGSEVRILAALGFPDPYLESKVS